MPTNAAARCKLDSVMSRFGSRMRSTCERLVFSKTALRAFGIVFLLPGFGQLRFACVPHPSRSLRSVGLGPATLDDFRFRPAPRVRSQVLSYRLHSVE
jgi:hypothetical protein